MRRLLIAVVFALSSSFALAAEDAGGAMPVDRIDDLIGAIGDEVERVEEQNVWSFKVEAVQLTVIADPNHDRMRVSSGALSFGGGDSNGLILRGLIDQLLKRGEDI